MTTAEDPRFTPNLSVQVPGEQAVVGMSSELAATARLAHPPPDIAVVHDPVVGVPLDGTSISSWLAIFTVA